MAQNGGLNMLAMNYRGPGRVRASHKPIPEILHPQDAIVRVTRSCICGSDLHLYHGNVPDTRVGTTFGHEFTGIVEETGEILSVQQGAASIRLRVRATLAAERLVDLGVLEGNHAVFRPAVPEVTEVGSIAIEEEATASFGGLVEDLDVFGAHDVQSASNGAACSGFSIAR